MTFVHKQRRTKKIRSDVNLTPLIDVMTALLAIFMITAPMLTTGIPLNLPKGDGKQIQGDEKTLDINIDTQGQIFIGSVPVTTDQLLSKVKAVIAENPNIKMMISADRTVEYGQVIEVMALLRVAGYTQVGLKTDPTMMRAPTPSDKKRK